MTRFTSQSLMVTAQSGQEAALPLRRRDPLPSEMGRVKGIGQLGAGVASRRSPRKVAGLLPGGLGVLALKPEQRRLGRCAPTAFSSTDSEKSMDGLVQRFLG